MPEGDTVWRAARLLDAALAGREVLRFQLRVPGSATADLRGARVAAVVPRGKHLLMRIGEDTVHSHLKMEGSWRLFRPGQPWSRPAHTARAIVGVDAGDAVGFDLAQLAVAPTSEEDRWVGHLGPDLLDAAWDATHAARAAAALRADERAAHVAVLDQRNLAGLGNIYANEVLFLRGISPFTPATHIDAEALVDTARRVMLGNLERPARTFTGNDRPGQRTWVYRREGQLCRRCGTLIRADTLGASATAERNVFWCPSCQP